MKPTMPAPVLRSPDHLLAAIPFLLGFRPYSSVVLVWIQSGSIALTQRVDWPKEQQDLHEWGSAVIRAARHVTAQGVVVVGYPPEHWTGVLSQSAAPLAAIGRQLINGEGQVLDAIIVSEDWWLALDTEFEATTAQARPFDLRITAEVSDDFMYSGWSFVADRAEVCAEFNANGHGPAVALPELDQLAVECAALDPDELELWRDQHVHLLLTSLEAGALHPNTAGRLAVGLHDIRVRDAVLWHLAHDLDANSSLRALRSLVRALPVGRRAPSATVASICAWLAGDGVRASAALDIAVQDEADYGLARLVGTALSNGLPPAMWQETMEQLRYEDCRHGLH